MAFIWLLALYAPRPLLVLRLEEVFRVAMCVSC